MFFKSLLAATLVTVSAVIWQVRHTPTNPSRGVEWTVESDQAPMWVRDPESFFGAPQEGVFLATGSARIVGSESVAHRRAMLKARMNLVKAWGAAQRNARSESERILEDGSVERTVHTTNPTTSRTKTTTSSPSTGSRETLTFERVEGTAERSEEVARWTSPEGVLWVLVAFRPEG